MSNLKQIGTGNVFYTNDYSSWIPPAYDRGIYWYASLEAYLPEITRKLHCRTNKLSTGATGFSYGWNENFGRNYGGGWSPGPRMKLSTVKSIVSKTVLAGDGTQDGTNAWFRFYIAYNSWYVGFVHTHTANIVLLDGHVESHRGVTGSDIGTWRTDLKWFPN